MHSVFVVACCVSQLLAADPEPTNLIQEPSFEGVAGDSGLPAGWFGIHSHPDGKYRFELVEGGRTGKKSLFMEGTGGYGVTWGEKLPIDAMKKYRARGYVRIEGDEQAAVDVKFHYYGANQEYLGQSRVGFVNPRSQGWQLITVSDELPLWPRARFIGVAVAVAGKGNAKAWFDDIEMFAMPRVAAPLNLIANGNMEDVAADRPAGWHILASEGNKPVASFDAEKKKEGGRSLRLSGNGEWAAAGSVRIDLQQLTPQTLTGWARVSRGEAIVQWAYFQDDKFLGVTASDPVTTDEWQSRTVTVELEKYPTATHVVAVASVKGDAEGWFDNISATGKTKAANQAEPAIKAKAAN